MQFIQYLTFAGLFLSFSSSAAQIEDGTYIGKLSCGSLQSDQSNPGWTVPLKIEKNGLSIAWSRGDEKYYEEGQAKLTDGSFSIDATGSWKTGSGKNGSWRDIGTVRIEGGAFFGSTKLTSPDGTQTSRNCTVSVPVRFVEAKQQAPVLAIEKHVEKKPATIEKSLTKQATPQNEPVVKLIAVEVPAAKLTEEILPNKTKTVEVGTTKPELASAGDQNAPQLTFTGEIKSPAEEGDQYQLVLSQMTPLSVVGNTVCGARQQASIELWDKKSTIANFVGKSVSVTGTLDCPRGGYVLRSISVTERVSSIPENQAQQLVLSEATQSTPTGATGTHPVQPQSPTVSAPTSIDNTQNISVWVAALVGLVILGGLAFVLIKRRGRNRKDQSDPSSDLAPGQVAAEVTSKSIPTDIRDPTEISDETSRKSDNRQAISKTADAHSSRQGKMPEKLEATVMAMNVLSSEGVFCSQCGAQQLDDARFCSKCGAKLDTGPVAKHTSNSSAPIQSPISIAPAAAEKITKGEFASPPTTTRQRLFVGAVVVVGVVIWLSKGASNIVGVFGESRVTSAAQQLVQKSLNSPASFQPVSATVVWKGKDKNRDAYIVKTAYDAQNGFGAMLRGCHYVSFSLQGDSIYSDGLFVLEKCIDGNRGALGMGEAQFIEVLAHSNFTQEKQAPK